jgi:hypothetical protein
LRFNVDPFDEEKDERILDLIKKAGLEYLLKGTSKQELENKKKAEEQDKKKKEYYILESDDEDKEKDGEKGDEEKDAKGLNFKV